MMDNIRRVLVMVTATVDCVNVVRYAEGLAKRVQASLYVLDVVHNPFAYSGWNLPIPSLEKDYQRLLDQAREHLKFMVGEKKEQELPIELIVREGDPAEEITKVVVEKEIDLLVLPNHEETRIEHFLSGKMVARIVRKMPCSVLLVKQEPVTLCET
jgi:universal stress protein A